MSPVYLNPQHSSSIPFLELKGDQHHNHPIIDYLHDHVTSINNRDTYFSSSNLENHHLSTQYLAMDYSRHAQEKVVGNLILSQEKANHNLGQVIQSSTQVQYASKNNSGCNNVKSFNQSDHKPKKCKPKKLRILHAATVTATEKAKKMIIPQRVQTYRNNNSNDTINNNGLMRMCTDCHTTTTPLWRSGPHGPKTLCNACGIRQRKARRAAMAAATSAKLAMDEATTSSMSSSTTSVEPPKLIVEEMSSQLKLEHDKSLTLPLKKRSKTLNNSSWSSNNINNNNIYHNNNNNYNYDKNYSYNSSQRAFPRDEEEGAILLMALSCG